MIASFGDGATEDLFHGSRTTRVKRIPKSVAVRAVRKLDMLDAAESLADLRTPPGNRLEELKGDLAGHHSVRVNAQWRLVFRWTGKDAHEVRLTDYH